MRMFCLRYMIGDFPCHFLFGCKRRTATRWFMIYGSWFKVEAELHRYWVLEPTCPAEQV